MDHDDPSQQPSIPKFDSETLRKHAEDEEASLVCRLLTQAKNFLTQQTPLPFIQDPGHRKKVYEKVFDRINALAEEEKNLLIDGLLFSGKAYLGKSGTFFCHSEIPKAARDMFECAYKLAADPDLKADAAFWYAYALDHSKERSFFTRGRPQQGENKVLLEIYREAFNLQEGGEKRARIAGQLWKASSDPTEKEQALDCIIAYFIDEDSGKKTSTNDYFSEKMKLQNSALRHAVAERLTKKKTPAEVKGLLNADPPSLLIQWLKTSTGVMGRTFGTETSSIERLRKYANSPLPPSSGERLQSS